MNNLLPVCATCNKPCGLIDQPGAYNMGDHWLCKPHYEEQKYSAMQSKRLFTPTAVD